MSKKKLTKGDLISAIILILFFGSSIFVGFYKDHLDRIYSVSTKAKIRRYRNGLYVEFEYKHKGKIHSGSTGITEEQKVLFDRNKKYMVNFAKYLPFMKGILLDYPVPDSLVAPYDGWEYNPLDSLNRSN